MRRREVPRWALPRRIVSIAAIAAISGCGMIAGPGPTAVEPPPGVEVEIAVDNRSGDGRGMTISQGGQLGPSMVVGACEASTFDYPIDGPFTVGFGLASGFPREPLPALVESSDLQLIDGGYRLLIRVAPAGTVTFGALLNSLEARGQGC